MQKRSRMDNDFDRGRREVFELISTAYYGKQTYFLVYDMVYNRNAAQYMTLDEVIKEFSETIMGE